MSARPLQGLFRRDLRLCRKRGAVETHPETASANDALLSVSWHRDGDAADLCKSFP